MSDLDWLNVETERTFVDACLHGEALLTDVDDWIAEWHASGSGRSLDAFLGFSSEEGALFAERPESLRFIVAAHLRRGPS